MPKLTLYVESKEEIEEMKKTAERLGASISGLVRAFFRGLERGSQHIIIDNSKNKVEIGEININLTQHNNVQINNNIIKFIDTKLKKAIEILNAALSKKSPLIMSQSIFLAKKELEEMLENIELLRVK